MLQAATSTSIGLAAICAAFAVGYLIMGLRGFSFARRARHWPSVQGTIARSQVGFQYRRHFVEAAHVDLEYRYEVRGQPFTGTRVSFESHAGDSKRIADATVARYPEGEPVRVFFDPGDPSESVLEPENTRRPRQALMFAIVAAAVGALVAAGDLFAWS